MQTILENLLKLQSLQTDHNPTALTRFRIKELRSDIPGAMLLHHDRLAAHGKQGLVEVRNQVCSGCHMRVSIGTQVALVAGDRVVTCDNCGRYLFLPAPANQDTPKSISVSVAPKPQRNTRKVLALRT